MEAGDKIIEDDRISMISEASIVVANLKKNEITEVKSFAKPPEGVKDVLTATLILLGRPKSEQSWSHAKKDLGRYESLGKEIAELDFEKVPIETRQEAMKYLSKYDADRIKKISVPAAAFYNWAIAVARD